MTASVWRDVALLVVVYFIVVACVLICVLWWDHYGKRRWHRRRFRPCDRLVAWWMGDDLRA